VFSKREERMPGELDDLERDIAKTRQKLAATRRALSHALQPRLPRRLRSRRRQTAALEHAAAKPARPRRGRSSLLVGALLTLGLLVPRLLRRRRA
jgi:hypothetical protein